MPERQQTEGDFGLRPIRPQQQIQDPFVAPRLPEPDLSVLEGIGKLSKTAFEVIDFKQKEEKFQRQAGKELGEAQPDYELGAGTTEAAMVGFQEGRGTALRSQFQTELESNWKIATAANEHLLNDTASYGVYHDTAMADFVSENQIEGLALNQFMSGSDVYRTQKTSDHVVASLGYKKKMFLSDADDIVLSSLTQMESDSAWISNMSVFDLVSATDDLITPEGEMKMPTSIYTLKPEDIYERELQLKQEAAAGRVKDLQDMFDGAYMAGPDTLKDVETRMIDSFIHELTEGSNPDMALMVMGQLTSGTASFMDRPAVMSALRKNATKIQENLNSMSEGMGRDAIIKEYVTNRGTVPLDELAGEMGVTKTEAKGLLEDWMVAHSSEIVNGQAVFSPRKFAATASSLASLEKLPKLGLSLVDSIHLARTGNIKDTQRVHQVHQDLQTFRALMDGVGKEKTMGLLGLNESQFLKLDSMHFFLEQRGEDGQFLHTVEQLQGHPMLRVDAKDYMKDVPTDEQFKTGLADVGQAWYQFGDADIIQNDVVDIAKRIYNYYALDPASVDLDSDQLMEKTSNHMAGMGYKVRDNRLIRLSGDLTLDDIDLIETNMKQQVVDTLMKQRDEYGALVREMKEKHPFKFNRASTPIGQTWQAFTKGFNSFMGVGILRMGFSEEAEYEEAIRLMAASEWELRNPEESLILLSEEFEDLPMFLSTDDIPLVMVSDHTSASPRYRFVGTETGLAPNWGKHKYRESYGTDDMINLRGRASQAEEARQAEKDKQTIDRLRETGGLTKFGTWRMSE